MRQCFLFIIAILLMLPLNRAEAQSDPKATIAALDSVIKKYGNYKDIIQSYVDDKSRKFNNNPEVLTGIAKAFYTFSKEPGALYYSFTIRDSTNAYKYLRLAMAADSNYVPAYVYAGDIQRTYYKRDEALKWYDRGIAANPKDPQSYLAYADYASEKNADSAVMRLLDLAKYDSIYPVNLAAARVYNKENKAQKALEYYKKADMRTMERYDLEMYATNAYMLGDLAVSDSVAAYAYQSYPLNITFNRIRLWSNAKLKHYDTAITHGEILFTKCEGLTLNLDDYQLYAEALKKKNRFDDAIAMYEKVVGMDSVSYAHRQLAERNVIILYREMYDYDKAIERCEKYIDKRRVDGKIDGLELDLLAETYRVKASELNGAEKTAAYMAADSVYSLIVKEAPENAVYGLYWGLEMGIALDQDNNGLAKDRATALEAFITVMPEEDKTRHTQRYLLRAYSYLGYFYAVNRKYNNKKLAIEYCEKALAIDPTADQATRVYNFLMKK